MKKKEMKKIYLILIVLIWSTTLYWCWESETEENEEREQKTFQIQVKEYWEFDSVTHYRKNWRVRSADQIELTAQASWRIDNINVKEWDRVSQWQNLLSLQDEVANYWLQVQSAQISLQQSQIDYEQTKVDLEKTIRDLERALRQAKNDYESTKKDFEKQLEQQEYDISLSDLESEESTAKRELENLENRLSSTKLELENLERRNQQNIRDFRTNLENNYDDYIDLVDDINYEADRVLWVSSANRNANNAFELYLWARNSSEKTRAENLLRDSIRKFDEMKNSNYSDVDNYDIIEKTEELLEASRKTRSLLDSIDTTLKASVTSSNFTQNQIDWYIEKFGWYRSNIQSFNSSLSNFLNDVESFFDNYLSEEELLKKEINNLEWEKDILRKNLEQSSFSQQISLDRTLLQKQEAMYNAQLAVENAEDDLEQAKRNKELTLNSLQNSIQSAETQLQEAWSQASKLNVNSPASWKITSVLVNRWQEVSQWTPLFEISADSEKEVRISFRESELDSIYQWMEVEIVHRWESYIWTIYSVSNLADQNLNYTARVRLNEEISRLWDFVTVLVFVDQWRPIIPVNILNNIQDNTAIINLYEDWEIVNKTVRIKEIIWEWVLLEEDLEDNAQIIKNNIRNYNEDEFILEVER